MDADKVKTVVKSYAVSSHEDLLAFSQSQYTYRRAYSRPQWRPLAFVPDG